MKNRWRNRFTIINYITTTEYFKVTFFLAVLLAGYGSFILGVSSQGFIDAIFIPFQFYLFNIFLFALFFFNTLNTSSVFSKRFDFYIIRLENKKRYLKEYIIINILSTLFQFLLFFLFYFMFLMLMRMGNLDIHLYEPYSISNLVYVIYFLFRYVLIVVLLCVITSLILMNFKSKITIIFSMIILFGFMIFQGSLISEFELPYLLVWTYFNDIRFRSFSIDLGYSSLFILLTTSITYVIYVFTYKRKRWSI